MIPENTARTHTIRYQVDEQEAFYSPLATDDMIENLPGSELAVRVFGLRGLMKRVGQHHRIVRKLGRIPSLGLILKKPVV